MLKILHPDHGVFILSKFNVSISVAKPIISRGDLLFEIKLVALHVQRLRKIISNNKKEQSGQDGYDEKQADSSCGIPRPPIWTRFGAHDRAAEPPHIQKDCRRRDEKRACKYCEPPGCERHQQQRQSGGEIPYCRPSIKEDVLPIWVEPKPRISERSFVG